MSERGVDDEDKKLDLERGLVSDDSSQISEEDANSSNYYIWFVLIVHSSLSISMTTSNKQILQLLPAPMFFLLFQYGATFLGVSVLSASGWRPPIAFSWSKLLEAIPANMFFLVMLISSNFSLALLSIPMVTVLKNFTTVAITLGDLTILRKPVSLKVWVSLAIMVASSVTAVAFDLEYNTAGYIWMVINILSQTAHVLFRYRMGEKMSIDETQIYVNAVGFLVMLPIVYFSESEAVKLIAVADSYTWFMLFLNAMLSVAIGYSSQWTLSYCGATVFSYAGSVNKLPLVILSWLIFPSVVTFRGVASVCIAIASAVLFVLGKRSSSASTPKELKN